MVSFLEIGWVPKVKSSNLRPRIFDKPVRRIEVAEAYEVMMGRWSRQLAPLFVEFVGVRDGERVLDVGCGTGSLSATLARVTGASKIVGIDIGIWKIAAHIAFKFYSAASGTFSTGSTALGERRGPTCPSQPNG